MIGICDYKWHTKNGKYVADHLEDLLLPKEVDIFKIETNMDDKIHKQRGNLLKSAAQKPVPIPQLTEYLISSAYRLTL